jgi:hypothetical protein
MGTMIHPYFFYTAIVRCQQSAGVFGFLFLYILDRSPEHYAKTICNLLQLPETKMFDQFVHSNQLPLVLHTNTIHKHNRSALPRIERE